jgi:PilZ domain
MVERRREPRIRSLLGGKAVFNRRHSVMDCLVRNIAPHGALVVFPHTSLTPSEFTLHIPHRNETYSAKLVWRRHDRAGVSLSETESFDVPIDTARRIRTLEIENRRLRKQLDPCAC